MEWDISNVKIEWDDSLKANGGWFGNDLRGLREAVHKGEYSYFVGCCTKSSDEARPFECNSWTECNHQSFKYFYPEQQTIKHYYYVCFAIDGQVKNMEIDFNRSIGKIGDIREVEKIIGKLLRTHNVTIMYFKLLRTEGVE
jgi:hypothetical protein